jgi:tRNA-2-methylthio-N6-dimethylallyladenosine synthase
VTLLGQNVNAYRGAMGDTAEIADLATADPVRRRDSRNRADPLHHLHPNEFTQRLIDAYAKVPQLVNHLHLPVQQRQRPDPDAR